MGIVSLVLDGESSRLWEQEAVDELVAGRKPRQDSSRDASRDSRNASWVLCWKTERLAHEVANSGPPERPQSDQIKETR